MNQGFMYRILEKLHLEQYLSPKLVLLADTVISELSTFVSLLLVTTFFHIHDFGIRDMIWTMVVSGVLCVSSFLLFGTYRITIRNMAFREVRRFFAAVVLKDLLIFCYLITVSSSLAESYGKLAVCLLFDVLLTLFVLMAVRLSMIVVYDVIRLRLTHREDGKSVLVYGTNDKSVSLVKRLQCSPHYRIMGFITFGKEQRGSIAADHKVYYFENKKDVEYLRNKYEAEAVLFANVDDTREEKERLIRYCTELNLKVLFAPPIDEMPGGKIIKKPVRDIMIEDLLGRPEIKISMQEIRDNFCGKTVLVTGAAGSIGSELCRQLASFGVKELVLFDNAETPMHNFRLEMEERFPDLKFVPVIGDVRVKDRLKFVFEKYRPQIVFHAAAYKHVPLMEENPCEAVFVNVAGSRNVADKCIEYGVDKMVMISTDKAVNPTNIMGCTKRLAEIYVQSLGLAIEEGRIKGKTKFVTTRFGNVLGSNGSVIPRFREQIAKGGQVTVTHKDITRFFMTIPEACRLVMEAATMSSGNQIFVFDMGASVKIADLAKRMIELAGYVPGKDIEIEYTGLRPGEKLYEEVLSNAENTLPTMHERIRIAKVRKYDYSEASKVSDELEELSKRVNIQEMVRLMKITVPEFKSKNSVYEAIDRELESQVKVNS